MSWRRKSHAFRISVLLQLKRGQRNNPLNDCSPKRKRGEHINRSKTWDITPDITLYPSQLVIDEVSAGDPIAARERLKILRSLSLLDITPEVTELAFH